MRKEIIKWNYLLRKTTVAALAAVLVLGCTTGCGSQKDKSGSKTSSEQSSDTDTASSNEDDSDSKETGKETKEDSKSASVSSLGIKSASSYIKKLAEYRAIKLKKSEIDKQLKERINTLLTQYPSAEKITSGKVKNKDIVNIYYVGKINGEEFDGGSCTKETQPDGYDLEIGSGTFISGFEESLIGKEIGKTVDINVTFPEDYSSEEVAGKDAVFTVTLNYKHGEKKFNDAFIEKNLSGNYSSAKDYKIKTRQEIIKSMAVSQVIDGTEIKEYPEELLKAIETQFVTPIEKYNESQGITMDQFISKNYSSKEDYENDLKKNVEAQLKGQIIYNAIAQNESIKVTEEELDSQIKTYIESYNVKTEKELDKQFKENYGDSARSLIYANLIYQKVADYLVTNVKEK